MMALAILVSRKVSGGTLNLGGRKLEPSGDGNRDFAEFNAICWKNRAQPIFSSCCPRGCVCVTHSSI